MLRQQRQSESGERASHPLPHYLQCYDQCESTCAQTEWLQARCWFVTFNGVVPPQACRDFVDVADSYSRRWQKALQHEKEQRHHLEETIEQLAKQHNSLERAWRENPSSYTGESRLQEIPGPLLACRITACMLIN